MMKVDQIASALVERLSSRTGIQALLSYVSRQNCSRLMYSLSLGISFMKSFSIAAYHTSQRRQAEATEGTHFQVTRQIVRKLGEIVLSRRTELAVIA